MQFSPSMNAKKEASSPLRNSSTTTVAPAARTAPCQPQIEDVPCIEPSRCPSSMQTSSPIKTPGGRRTRRAKCVVDHHVIYRLVRFLQRLGHNHALACTHEADRIQQPALECGSKWRQRAASSKHCRPATLPLKIAVHSHVHGSCVPAARPLVLTTMGAPHCVMKALASAGLVKVSYCAVGMLYFLHLKHTNLRCR